MVGPTCRLVLFHLGHTAVNGRAQIVDPVVVLVMDGLIFGFVVQIGAAFVNNGVAGAVVGYLNFGQMIPDRQGGGDQTGGQLTGDPALVFGAGENGLLDLSFGQALPGGASDRDAFGVLQLGLPHAAYGQAEAHNRQS